MKKTVTDCAVNSIDDSMKKSENPKKNTEELNKSNGKRRIFVVGDETAKNISSFIHLNVDKEKSVTGGLVKHCINFIRTVKTICEKSCFYGYNDFIFVVHII